MSDEVLLCFKTGTLTPWFLIFLEHSNSGVLKHFASFSAQLFIQIAFCFKQAVSKYFQSYLKSFNFQILILAKSLEEDYFHNFQHNLLLMGAET